jgi:hypothetical protein
MPMMTTTMSSSIRVKPFRFSGSIARSPNTVARRESLRSAVIHGARETLLSQRVRHTAHRPEKAYEIRAYALSYRGRSGPETPRLTTASAFRTIRVRTIRVRLCRRSRTPCRAPARETVAALHTDPQNETRAGAPKRTSPGSGRPKPTALSDYQQTGTPLGVAAGIPAGCAAVPL